MRTKKNIEDVKENSFLQSIRGKKFFYSPLFAILVCVYIYVCWITKINFYAIPFIAVLAFLILIFCKDTSPLLILLFTLIQPLRNLEVTKINIIIAGASFGLFVIGLIINIIRFRPFKKIGRLNGFLVACIFLGIAICLGGVIIPNRDLKAILPTIIFGVVVIFLSFYMFYSLGLGNEDRRAPLKLVCTAIICSSIIAALQLLFVIFSSGNPVAVISGQIELSAGYADPSYLANILGRSIPICIYLATKPKKLSFLWLWPAYIFGIFLILLSQRMSLLVAAIIAIVALICFLKNIKIHKLEWVCTFIMLVGLTFFIAAFMYKRFREMFVQLFQQSTFEQEIWAFWKRGISDYSSSPIFGVGLVPDPAASDKTFNISSGFIWYNNTIIQSFASFGILGLLSLLVFLFRQFQCFAHVFRASIKETRSLNQQATATDFYGKKILVNKVDYLVLSLMLSLIFIFLLSMYDMYYFTVFDFIEIIAITCTVFKVKDIDNSQICVAYHIYDKIKKKKNP